MSFKMINKLKVLSLLISLFLCNTLSAELTTDGYYRVSNYMTKRYVYVRDNKGWLNMSTSQADLGAIELWRGLDNTISDPASVMYFKKAGNQWDIECQGTSVYSMISHYVNVRSNTDGTCYMYGSASGMTQYLGDARQNDTDQGVMSGSATGDYRKWYVTPINNSTDNYFGVAPTVQANGRYYAPFYAAFPFSVISEGVHVYYVKAIENGVAIIEEIKGVVPASTPVIIECVSNNPSDNRLQLGGSGSTISGNLLGGVYFCNTTSQHKNLTDYNKTTMRLLGVSSDGKIGFVTGTITNLPANKSYLKVPSDCPEELKMMTREEYEDFIARTPTAVEIDPKELQLKKGEQYSLTAKITPSAASGDALTWESTASDIVTVDKDGNITAIAGGNAVITVKTSNGLTAECKVTVTVPVESITLDNTELSLSAGETAVIKATVLPQDATQQTLEWKSSNEDIATVDSTGTVTIANTGVAYITVSATDGSGITATCTVYGTTALEIIGLDEDIYDVYDLRGQILRKAVTFGEVNAMSPGIYILRGKNRNIKYNVR